MFPRLHVLEDDNRMPPFVDDLEDGDTVCLDSPTMLNLGLGDQIQVFPDLEVMVYIVVDIVPAVVFDIPDANFVVLRNVY